MELHEFQFAVGDTKQLIVITYSRRYMNMYHTYEHIIELKTFNYNFREAISNVVGIHSPLICRRYSVNLCEAAFWGIGDVLKKLSYEAVA